MKKSILNKIAQKSLKNERLKNAIIILTIALSTCMMVVLALVFADQRQKNESDLAERYQVSYEITEKEQYEKLKKCEEAEKVGIFKRLLTVDKGEYQVVVSFADSNLLDLQQYTDKLEGRLPEKENEIILVEDYVKSLGEDLKPGEEISMDIGDGNQTYTVSGILDIESAPSVYMALVSEAYYNRNAPDAAFSAYVKIKGAENYTKKELIEKAKFIQQDIGVPEKQKILSSYYFGLLDIGHGTQITVGVFVCLIIVIACVLVIYNIFYISVLNKAGEYGKLRTIGASKKQIRKIIRKEGVSLWKRAVPIGVAAGLLIGSGMISGKPDIAETVGIIIGISILIYLVVQISTLKPGKMASCVPPIVAMKQSGIWEQANKKNTKKAHRKLSPANLAWISLLRFKKKTVLTIVSLGFCGILLLAGASYLQSVSPEQMSKAMDFPTGNIRIEFLDGTESYDEKELRNLQEKNYFSAELEEQVKGIEGVRSVTRTYGLTVKAKLGEFEDMLTLDAIMDHGYQELKNHVKSGEIDSEEMKNGNFVVVFDQDWELIYNWTPRPGEYIEIIDSSGAKQKLQIAAVVDEKFNDGGTNRFFVSYDTLEKIGGSSQLDYTYQLVIETEEGKALEAENKCFELIQEDSALGMQTLGESIEHNKEVMKKQMLPIYGIVSLIGVFGVLNLVNTLITNIITRKKELSLLQTIGLSNRQMQKMLLLEGIFYFLGMVILTLAAGLPIGICLCRVLDGTGTFGTVVYHFPLEIMAGYFAVIFLLLCILSVATLKIYRKESLVERMRSDH